jgi:hypothetical protein
MLAPVDGRSLTAVRQPNACKRLFDSSSLTHRSEINSPILNEGHRTRCPTIADLGIFDSMISGSLAAPTPLRDGIREDQGDDENDAQSQSHIVPLVNAADLA